MRCRGRRNEEARQWTVNAWTLTKLGHRETRGPRRLRAGARETRGVGRRRGEWVCGAKNAMARA
jgi:hypothetical protein